MTICSGLAPGPRGRTRAHAQRCGAFAEAGLLYCVAHLQAAGWKRCCACRAWMAPATIVEAFAHKCPQCGTVHEAQQPPAR